MNYLRIGKRYWLALVLLIFLLLRLPSLFEPFTYGDEGIYLSLGQAAQKGQVWYRDIHDNKPPMLYLVAALAGNFRTYRLIHFTWGLVTILAFWQLSLLVFPQNRTAQILSTFSFTLLFNLHRFEGNVANAENFMAFLTIAGFYLIYEQNLGPKTKKRLRSQTPAFFYTAGTLFGLATLFKAPAAFDLAGAICFLFLTAKYKKGIRQLLKKLFYLILGFISPLLMSFIYYAAKNALGNYWIAAFAQNLPYLSSWNSYQPRTGGLPLALISRGLVVMAVILILFVFRKKLPEVIKLVVSWFAFSWFAALLSTRPYPHYLLQVIPPLSLSFGLIVYQKNKSFRFKSRPNQSLWFILLPLALITVFQATFSIFHFWTYPNREYYANFYQYALDLKDKQTYYHDFDPKSETLYQTANFIRLHTLPSDRIFIWGTEPSVYSLAQRSPVGRYTTSYHIIDFNGYQETIRALKKSPPRYLIVSPEEKRPFPELENFIDKEYTLEKRIGNLKIYRLVLFSP